MLEPTKLLKKSALRAFTSSGNLIAGAGSLLLSVVTVNPLPVILYSVGSLVWMYRSVSTGRYTKEILEAERNRQWLQAQEEQRTLLERMQAILSQPLFRYWTRTSELPDYMERYQRLLSLREKIAHLAQDRPEVGQDIESSILHQMDHMLMAYLKLVKSRVTYLCVLIRDGNRAVDDGIETPPRDRKQKTTVRRLTAAGPTENLHAGDNNDRPLPTLESRVSELQRRIDDLRQLSEQQPGARDVRQTHISLLEKQIHLLLESSQSDQRVVAQLDAFTDAFEFIYDRLSASQVAPSGITGFMGEVVQQVDETIRFAETFRPDMDTMLGELTTNLVAQQG